MKNEDIIKHYETLKSSRGTFESHWFELAKFFLPNKDEIFDFNRMKYEAARGEKKYSDLYDSTGPQALNLLASALHGMLTNPTIKWFDLYTGIKELDELDSVRRWLQACVNRIHEVLNNSNFQNEAHENYLDLGCFGTTTLRIEEDDEEIVKFHARPVYECVVKENYKGVVDTVFREYRATGEDIVGEFGFDPFKKENPYMANECYQKEYTVIHAVFPRESLAYDRKGVTNMPFASVKVLKDFAAGKYSVESGFNEFPYCVPRWTKITGEVYGRSPSMSALPDVKMLNEMKKTMIRSAQKRVDPPLLVADDGVIGPVRIVPGGITYYRAGTQDPIRPLDLRGDAVDFGYQMIADIQRSIREVFFIDQLQLADGPQMTATEVMQRTEEKLRVLAPVLGRMHNEYLKPLINRVFGILFRRGELPPNMPEELEGMTIKVNYSSMIARSQKASEAENIRRTLELSAPFMEIDPNVRDNIDADKAFRYISSIFSLPQEMLRDQDDIEEMREMRAQQMEQAQQQMQDKEESEVVRNLAQAD